MVSCCRVAAAAAAACHLLPINTTTCRWQSRWWTKAGNVAKKQCNARRRKEGGEGCSRGEANEEARAWHMSKGGGKIVKQNSKETQTQRENKLNSPAKRH